MNAVDIQKMIDKFDKLMEGKTVEERTQYFVDFGFEVDENRLKDKKKR